MPRPQNQGKKPGAQNMQISSQGQKQNQRPNWPFEQTTALELKNKPKPTARHGFAIFGFPFFKEQTLTRTAVDGFCTDVACLS